MLPRWLVLADTPDFVVIQTTRHGLVGQSESPYVAFNMALHVGDNPQMVLQQRNQLFTALKQAYPCLNRFVFLNQTHGITVYDVDTSSCYEHQNKYAMASATLVDADASMTVRTGQGLVIMTADCLPIVLVDSVTGICANIHAGWKGLLDGVIESTIHAMQTKIAALGHTLLPSNIVAYFGAAIGADAFEVGAEVRAAFMEKNMTSQQYFSVTGANKYKVDIYALARQRLQQMGVQQCIGGTYCTVQQADLFYSYRRDRVTGRMATIVLKK